MRKGARTISGPARVALLAVTTVIAASTAQAAAPGNGAAPAESAPSEASVRTARELFRQAMAAQDRGDSAEALAKLRRVADVRATPAVLFYIAYNEEKLGQLVIALTHMSEANKGLEAAAADRHAAQYADAAKLLPFARAELAQLDARVPHLRVLLSPVLPAEEQASVTVTVDGSTITGDAWSHLAVAAGEHRVAVQAPGYEGARVEASARENATVDVPVTLVKVAPVVAAPIAPSATPTDDTTDAGHHGHGAAIATTAGAVVLLGGGIASFLVAGHDASSGRSECAASPSCSPPRTAIRTFDAVALGAWIGAAGLGALSIVLWTRSSSSSSPPASSSSPAAARFTVGPGSGTFETTF